MAINRSQLAKELEPGLNALFGMEYARYDSEHEEIYETESSDRAFEEEVMIVGFGNASVKAEGAGVSFDNATEGFTSRYNHETVALAFALTEEAVKIIFTIDLVQGIQKPWLDLWLTLSRLKLLLC